MLFLPFRIATFQQYSARHTNDRFSTSYRYQICRHFQLDHGPTWSPTPRVLRSEFKIPFQISKEIEISFKFQILTLNPESLAFHVLSPVTHVIPLHLHSARRASLFRFYHAFRKATMGHSILQGPPDRKGATLHFCCSVHSLNMGEDGEGS